MKKLLCKLFGHQDGVWNFVAGSDNVQQRTCHRCKCLLEQWRVFEVKGDKTYIWHYDTDPRMLGK